MKYLLDTDHISILQRPGSAEHFVLSGRIDQHPRDDFGLSVVSFHEQVLGAHTYLNRARRPAELVRGYVMLHEVLTHYAAAAVVPFDAAALAEWTRLKGLKLRTSPMDLRIAAISLANGLILLTRNLSDFAVIPGLVIEDWTV